MVVYFIFPRYSLVALYTLLCGEGRAISAVVFSHYFHHKFAPEGPAHAQTDAAVEDLDVNYF